MKIKIFRTQAIVDVSPVYGVRLIEQGKAVAVKDAPKPALKSAPKAKEKKKG